MSIERTVGRLSKGIKTAAENLVSKVIMFGHTFFCGSLVNFCFLNLSYAFLLYNRKEVLAGVFKKILLERKSFVYNHSQKLLYFSIFV